MEEGMVGFHTDGREGLPEKATLEQCTEYREGACSTQGEQQGQSPGWECVALADK